MVPRSSMRRRVVAVASVVTVISTPSTNMDTTDQLVLVTRDDRVGILQLNRPAQLNALNDPLIDALGAALLQFDADPDIGCIVLLGDERAFAAGADIAAASSLTFQQAFKTNFVTRNWEVIRQVRKPVIAGVAGYALGGGCELAMMCDVVIAADSARFGQPEIKLGMIPGAGGTQRRPRAISKAKAMDLLLTGRLMDAHEAERARLVSRVVSSDRLRDEVLSAATMISTMSLPSVMAMKECVDRAFESSLSEGVLFERRQFHALFGTQDQKEGMAAFLEKRVPQFTHD